MHGPVNFISEHRSTFFLNGAKSGFEMCFAQHLGCRGQNTSRIQNKEVYATLCLQAHTLEMFYSADMIPMIHANTQPPAARVARQPHCNTLLHVMQGKRTCSSLACGFFNVMTSSSCFLCACGCGVRIVAAMLEKSILVLTCCLLVNHTASLPIFISVLPTCCTEACAQSE